MYVESLIGPESAAIVLGTKPEHLPALRKQGLPFIKLSHKCIRYSVADLTAFVAAHRHVPLPAQENS